MTKMIKDINPEMDLGFNVMLLGAPGSGKTTAIATLAKAGLEVFVAFTEQGVSNFRKALKLHGLTEEQLAKVHYAYISPARGSFAGLAKGAGDILKATEFGKMMAGNRKDHSQFLDLLNLCANFVDQNGESFGPVDSWDASRVFVTDGMSGLNDMAMALVVGDKPVKTLQDWGVAIDQLDKFVKQCCNMTCCYVNLAHLEQEKDEVTGRMVITASTLGRKLGTTIGRHFQDVVLCSKNKSAYQWATEDSRIELKASNLKAGTGLPASFEPLVEKWLASLEENV